MRSRTVHNHKFDQEELEELKEDTGEEKPEDALEGWVRHNYPIKKSTHFVIGEVEAGEEGGKIEVIER